MDKEVAFEIDQYVDAHKDEILADLARLVRIPSVSKPGGGAPAPFGEDCARVLAEAVAMAAEKGMDAKNYDNWYALAVRGTGAHTIGIFSHLDVVEAGSGWTFPPFEMTEKDGWLFGRGVADDKIAAVMGMHTAKALDTLGLAPHLQLLLFLGVNEENGMLDIDRYLQEHEQPEFNLVPDFKFPGSIGETGVIKFKLHTQRRFACLTGFRGGEAGKRLPLNASASYTGVEGGKLFAAAETQNGIALSGEGGVVHVTAEGRPDSSWGAQDSVNALFALASFLSGNDALPDGDRSLLGVIAEMTGASKGECFAINRESPLFGATKCTCTLAEETDSGLTFHFDVRYPFEITGEEIQTRISAFCAQHGFELSGFQDTKPWLLNGEDPRLNILCACWKDVSGRDEKMGVGGGTYARKLKNAVSYGPKDFSKCPFIPKGHGEIHSPDETRSVETVLNAVKVYIRAFVELDAYYGAM